MRGARTNSRLRMLLVSEFMGAMYGHDKKGQSVAPSQSARDRCSGCGDPIPPGKAGRKCWACRNAIAEHE